MEKIFLKYNFEDAYFFFPKGKTAQDFNETKRAIVKDGCPISVTTPKCPVIVTQQLAGDSRLFMVENIGNPMDEAMHGQRATKITIDLGKYAEKAKFYVRGKEVQREIADGKIQEKMHCGDAIFIEIE